MNKYIIFGILAIGFISCEEETYIPKPPTYLRIDLPDHEYNTYEGSCPYTFEKASIFKVEDVPGETELSCNKKIDLGPLNGMAFMRYWKMDKPLSYYVNNANDEIDRHKIKATNIKDEQIIRPNDNVYGTMFELQGDVATPYQFYLTDSTNHFVYCELLFNSSPNYDSLRPSIDYLREDLKELLNSFKWKE